ncbi:DHHA1 domain-containing protein, partial [Prochlorothrix hollandica]|uniref:DHHA1 domain-containing protein n=1 Tax=Prochlorothrix hollandica TaxID=1223 RepID=UPI0033404B47
FGIGPRINAVSRVQGDARLCVELLTSREGDRCRQLAEQAEVLNLRRKALQRDLQIEIAARLAQVDLSTTPALVLGAVGWPVGILGLVAGQVAQTYQRPTVLLSLEAAEPTPEPWVSPSQTNGSPLTQGQDPPLPPLARGSARSIKNLNLYDLLLHQGNLLHRFGGHPMAAGLSLPIAHIPLFTAALEQTLRQHQGYITPGEPTLTVDLTVRVADLGNALFQALRLLEPYGMGNPPPRLLVQDCWFKEINHRNAQDYQGRTVRYIRTTFELWDESYPKGIPGIWWEHYADDLPPGRCDAVVELGIKTGVKGRSGQHQVTLIAVRPRGSDGLTVPESRRQGWLLDWRTQMPPADTAPKALVLRRCPRTWEDLQQWAQRAVDGGMPLALAYGEPWGPRGTEPWFKLVGWVKQWSQSSQLRSWEQIIHHLGISDRTLDTGIQALQDLGFQWQSQEPHQDPQQYTCRYDPNCQTPQAAHGKVQRFLQQVEADRFQQDYFCRGTIEALAAAIVLKR